MAKSIDIFLNLKTANFNRNIKTANVQMSSMGRTMGRVQRTATAFFALFAIRRVGAFMGEAVSAFATFEKGIANIGILLSREKGRLGEFAEATRSLSKEFGVATSDILKAGFDIQSAVGDVAKSLDIMTAATKLAVAGGSDMVATTSGLVTLMESYGHTLKGAEDAANLLLIAQEKARATIGELASSVARFLPMAAKLKISQEEVFAVFAQVTRGLGRVRESATALAAVIQLMLKPTDNLKRLSQEWFGTTIQQALAQHGLIKVLEKFKTIELSALGVTLGRRRAIKGVLTVLDDLPEVEKWAIEMMSRDMFVQRKLVEQMKTTEKQIDRTKESWRDLVRVLGEDIAAEIPFRPIQRGLQEITEEIEEKGLGGALNRVVRTIRTWGMSELLRVLSEEATELTKEILEVAEATNIVGQNMNFTYLIYETNVKKRLQALKDIQDFEEMVENAGITKMEERIEVMRNEWNAWWDEKTAGTMAQLQEDTEFLKVALDAQRKAHESMWVLVGQMKDRFAQSLSATFMDMIKGTKSVEGAFKDLGFTMLKVLIDFAVQKAINSAMSIAFRAEETAASIAAAAIQLPIWTKLAAMVSLASFGANAPPAIAGMAATHAAAAGLAIPAMQKGGIVPGIGRGDRIPALLEPGEAVIPRQDVSRVLNNNQRVNVAVNMAGALILDDPNAVEKLYREGIRDRIMTDIRTGKDKFF